MKPHVNVMVTMVTVMVLSCLLLLISVSTEVQAKDRVLFLMETGSPESAEFNQLLINSITKSLDHDCYEVVSPPAEELSREDAYGGRLFQQYNLSVIYSIRTDVFRRETAEGYVQLKGRLFVDGFDCNGNTVPPFLNMSKREGRDFKQASSELAQAFAGLVVRNLSESCDSAPAKVAEDVTVTVVGYNDQVTIEAIGKLIRGSIRRGKGQGRQVELISAFRHPVNPLGSKAFWQVDLPMDLSQDILKNNILEKAELLVKAGGEAVIDGIRYQYDYEIIAELAGLTIGNEYGKGNIALGINAQKMESWKRVNPKPANM